MLVTPVTLKPPREKCSAGNGISIPSLPRRQYTTHARRKPGICRSAVAGANGRVGCSVSQAHCTRLAWVEAIRMERLARTTNQLFFRYRYGLWAYWFINAALIVEEARWHLLTRLTLWDITTLVRLAGAMAHPHAPPV